MSSIKLDDVCKTFKQTVAMDSVSYQVPRGCVFALLGENGAGKTTTIRTLLGLEKPDRGQVEVLGLDPQKKAVEIRRAVGYVPEQPVLYDWMKVEQIGWFVAGFHADGFLGQFIELAREFELPLDKKIRTLSKGMRAKVSLALAMSHQPELLILDEPTSGLDTLVRRKFLESMVDVAATGRTVFLSSHQISEVERVADHVAIMLDGKVVACQELSELKQQMEQWRITSDSPQMPLVEDATVISARQKHRQWELVVKNPGPESLWKLRDHPTTIDVEVNTPSLEDIFVAFVDQKSNGDASNNASLDRGSMEARP